MVQRLGAATQATAYAEGLKGSANPCLSMAHCDHSLPYLPAFEERRRRFSCAPSLDGGLQISARSTASATAWARLRAPRRFLASATY